MNGKILEIVMFLIDYMRSRQGRLPASDDFSITLRNMGYTDHEISSAYFWLMNRFDNPPEEVFADFPAIGRSTRILTDSERMQLTTGAHGLLLKLLSFGLIDDEDLETILERVNFFGSEPVTEEQIKLVASSVVFDGLDEITHIDSLTDPAGKSPLIN